MIEMRPVTDIRPGDVLSTDGYSVSAVVRLSGEVMVATALEGHEKTGYFAPDASLPVWTPDV